MKHHRSHLKRTAALYILAGLAILRLDAYAAEFVLKETSADKVVCPTVGGVKNCDVENFGRYTLDIKVSQADFDNSGIKFKEINECSPIEIKIGNLYFTSQFCDADKWPVYPWRDLNAKWSESQPGPGGCKRFGANGECLKEDMIVHRTIVAKILKTGGMLLKINGIYADNLGGSVLKNYCDGVLSGSTVPTNLSLMIGNIRLPIPGNFVCNTKTTQTMKYNQQFELTKMTISAKSIP